MMKLSKVTHAQLYNELDGRYKKLKRQLQQQRERMERLKILLEDMTELHAEDCKEDECVNILAVRKYLAELEATNDHTRAG